MSNSLKIRSCLVLGCLIIALVSLGPTLFENKLPDWWNKAFNPINLGLDLQGGMHLVLGVDVDKAVESQIDTIVDQAEGLLLEKDVTFKRVNRFSGERVTVTVYDEEAGKQVDTIMMDSFPSLEALTFTTEGGYIQKNYRLSDTEIEAVREYAVRQALETLRNRVDELGLTEPVLQRQAGYRILIQLPGIEDPERAIKLLDQTALLEFKMVLEGVTPEEAASQGGQVLYERKIDQSGGLNTGNPIVVERKTILTGDLLSNAQVRIDTRFNDPYVAIDFNSVGAKRFDQITAANVGKRMAIVLDDKVYSAPVIRERISGGSAQISGSFTSQEATDLAIILRAGSLPAPVEILENRSVGPSLGQDSIDQGILSVLIGGLLVIVAMLIYYKFSGLVANVVLILNLVFIMAILSILGATLTLPGIAGIVLTVGMAVDANVLIFERIREEMRLGRTARAALEAGFDKAKLTIIDANVTTLIAALVLFQFGTGPVKGFAVTLSVGILSSLFTAVIVSRLIFELYLSRGKVDRLSI